MKALSPPSAPPPPSPLTQVVNCVSRQQPVYLIQSGSIRLKTSLFNITNVPRYGLKGRWSVCCYDVTHFVLRCVFFLVCFVIFFIFYYLKTNMACNPWGFSNDNFKSERWWLNNSCRGTPRCTGQGTQKVELRKHRILSSREVFQRSQVNYRSSGDSRYEEATAGRRETLGGSLCLCRLLTLMFFFFLSSG